MKDNFWTLSLVCEFFIQRVYYDNSLPIDEAIRKFKNEKINELNNEVYGR
jgi:hypothetical protein